MGKLIFGLLERSPDREFPPTPKGWIPFPRATTALLLLATALSAVAQEQMPDIQADPRLEELARLRTQHAERVEVSDEEAMDPAVFTQLSPYAAEQTAVKLPEDQRLD